ncbi:MAG: sugar ABC transporter ATP-binding protein, partial [Acidimicrobiia bacterium]|nr:sugar ABC transporter ATP-binding protein [Acidimicrobiia bacterium]
MPAHRGNGRGDQSRHLGALRLPTRRLRGLRLRHPAGRPRDRQHHRRRRAGQPGQRTGFRLRPGVRAAGRRRLPAWTQRGGCRRPAPQPTGGVIRVNEHASPNGNGSSRAPLLQLRGICRSFGHVRAVHEVDVDLQRNEILGIVGDNGAGKSTLMKIIAGTVSPDSGRILMNGEPVEITTAQDSRRLGIEMIYQDLALFDNLDVAANVFIGREPT